MHGSRGYGARALNNAQSDEERKPNAVISVLLWILAVLLMCFFIVLAVVRSLGVGHIIRNTDIVEIIEDASLGEHTYYIVDQINGLPFSDVEVDLHDVEEFIKRKAVTDEIDIIIDGYTMAFVFGNLDHHVTTEDVVKLARRLEPEFYDFFGHRLTEEDFEYLAMTLDDILDFDSLSIDGIMQDFDIDRSLVTIPIVLLSPVLIWSVGLLSVALLVLIVILRRRNIADAFLSVGIPIALSGIIAFIAGLFIGSNTEMLGDTAQRFTRFIEDPVYLITQYGFAFAAVGVTISLVAFVFKYVAPRKNVY